MVDSDEGPWIEIDDKTLCIQDSQWLLNLVKKGVSKYSKVSV